MAGVRALQDGARRLSERDGDKQKKMEKEDGLRLYHVNWPLEFQHDVTDNISNSGVRASIEILHDD